MGLLILKGLLCSRRPFVAQTVVLRKTRVGRALTFSRALQLRVFAYPFGIIYIFTDLQL